MKNTIRAIAVAVIVGVMLFYPYGFAQVNWGLICFDDVCIYEVYTYWEEGKLIRSVYICTVEACWPRAYIIYCADECPPAIPIWEMPQ